MGSFSVYAYAHLGSAAHYYLELAETSERMQFFNCMSTIVYSAFAGEAFFNHIAIERNLWRAEDRMRPKEKLQMLSKAANLSLDFGKEPLQSFGQAVWFRNQMAHGRTTEVAWVGEFPERADWESLSNLRDAQRIFANTRELIVLVGNAFGITGSGNPFTVRGVGGRWTEGPAGD